MKKITTTMTIAALASLASAQTLNTAIWFDGSNQQVNTGADCMYEYQVCEKSTMGYWYDYDDRKNDLGDSYASYPSVADEFGSLIAPMIESYAYVAIAYELVKPSRQSTQYPYNFVGIGFNIVDGNQSPFDITGTNGLCVTYTADHPVTLEIGADQLTGSAACAVTLAKATTPTKVDNPIANFKQPDWAEGAQKIASCDQAFAAAGSIKFKMDGSANNASGKLRIFEVGPVGTCTGAGSIASEGAFSCVSDGQGGCTPAPDAIKGVQASNVKATLSGRVLSFQGFNSDASYEIVSLQGQVVKSGKVMSSVSLSSLDAGVYMVRVAGKSVSMNQKILVK